MENIKPSVYKDEYGREYFVVKRPKTYKIASRWHGGKISYRNGVYRWFWSAQKALDIEADEMGWRWAREGQVNGQ